MKNIKSTLKRILATSLIFLVGCSNKQSNKTEEFTPEIIISPKLYSSSSSEEYYNNSNENKEETELSTVITWDENLYDNEDEFEVLVIISETNRETEDSLKDKSKVLTKHLS